MVCPAAATAATATAPLDNGDQHPGHLFLLLDPSTLPQVPQLEAREQRQAAESTELLVKLRESRISAEQHANNVIQETNNRILDHTLRNDPQVKSIDRQIDEMTGNREKWFHDRSTVLPNLRGQAQRLRDTEAQLQGEVAEMQVLENQWLATEKRHREVLAKLQHELARYRADMSKCEGEIAQLHNAGTLELLKHKIDQLEVEIRTTRDRELRTADEVSLARQAFESARQDLETQISILRETEREEAELGPLLNEAQRSLSQARANRLQWQAQLDERQRAMNELQGFLQRIQRDRADAEKQLQEANQYVSRIQVNLSNARSQLAQFASRTAALRQEKQAIEQQIRALQARTQEVDANLQKILNESEPLERQIQELQSMQSKAQDHLQESQRLFGVAHDNYVKTDQALRTFSQECADLRGKIPGTEHTIKASEGAGAAVAVAAGPPGHW